MPAFPDAVIPPDPLRRGRATAGFSTVQALMGMAIVVIAGLASIEALILTNRKAATMRTLNNARAVAQRNIDTALGVPFDANAAAPPILALGTDVPYDDDGDGVLTVPIVVQRNGTSVVVNGTLVRTVTQEGTEGDIRRITFYVGWPYRGGSLTAAQKYNVTMTTLRSTD